MFIFLFILISIVVSSDKWGDEEYIMDLTSKSFKKNVLNGKGLWLVLFYAPWCGHCKNLKPHLSEAAKRLGGVIKIGRVNCDDERSIASKYGIQGFPTMKIFYPNGDVRDYQGQRTAPAIAKDLVSRFKGLSHEINTLSQSETVAPDGDYNLILFSSKESVPNLLKSVSFDIPEIKYYFQSIDEDDVENNENLQKYDVSSVPSLVLLHPNEGFSKYEGKLKKNDIIEFLREFVPDDGSFTPKKKKEEIPPKKREFVVDEIKDIKHLYKKCEKLCVIGTVKNEEEGKLLKRIAQQYESNPRLRFLSYKFQKGEVFLDDLGISQEDFQKSSLNLAVLRLKKNKYYVQMDVTEENYELFFDRMEFGNIKYEKLSEYPKIDETDDWSAIIGTDEL